MDQQTNNNPLRTADIHLFSPTEANYFKTSSFFYWYAIIIFFALVLTIILNQPVIVILAATLPLSFYSYLSNGVRNKRSKELIQKVGSILNFEYLPFASMQTVSGQLFKQGHRQLIFNVISGHYKDMPMRVYNFETIIGAGKNQRTLAYIVFEFTFDFSVPHLLVENAWEFIDFPNSIEVYMAELKNRFKIYTEKNMELEVFQIFTPDVTENFVNRNKNVLFNFELFDHKLYVFQPAGVAVTVEKMADLYDTAMMVLEIAPKLKMMSGSVKAIKDINSRNE